MKKKISFFLVLFFYKIFAYESDIESLFDTFSKKAYELKDNGEESEIIRIRNIDDFISNVFKSQKPIICVIYSSKTERSKSLLNDLSYLMEDKPELKKKLECVAVDSTKSSNLTLIKKFTDIFVQCLLQLNKLDSEKTKSDEKQNESLKIIKEKVSQMLRTLVFEGIKSDTFTPIMIFFKGSDLIIPKNSSFNKKLLLHDIEEQLFKK